MGLFTFNINYVVDEETKNDIRDIKKTQKKIMALTEQLQETVNALQVSVDTLQEKITNTIPALNETIASLELQLAEGVTPAKAQELLDQLTAIKTDLESTQV